MNKKETEKKKNSSLNVSPPKEITPKDVKIENYFHYPLYEAASVLGMEVKDLKKICKEKGHKRWPYRNRKEGNPKKESFDHFKLKKNLYRNTQTKTTNKHNIVVEFR